MLLYVVRFAKEPSNAARASSSIAALSVSERATMAAKQGQDCFRTPRLYLTPINPLMKTTFCNAEKHTPAPIVVARRGQSHRGIIGPRHVIQVEIIDCRDWEEVTSSDGVRSYVSYIGKRALIDGGAA